ncbi:hypothetical protein [Salinisphaera sp. LB1]|uniref:hypothetical protein n=1 Tax=Salinisphaera sp. LB1 TaxID=2183911 RepID=UPI000D7DC6BF|nr:hypothetical protein [Salinisphaera sp. LB1]AWN16296.1 hypothetical protein SALB1_2098 [Salinisphaera sp. LB1]
MFVIAVWLFARHMQLGAITADWGWLFRAGQAIWANGLPHHDLFSWTFPDRHWVLYQWLFEAIAAPMYSVLGITGSVFAVGLLGLATYALIPACALRRHGLHPFWPMLIGALVLLPVSTNLGLRPMLASNLALLAQYLVIQRLRAGDAHRLATSAWIAAIYALWSNMHLGFTLGLLSITLFAAGDLWTRARDPIAATASPPSYALLFIVAVLASGLNPYGWTLYGYIVNLSLETRMNAHIHELMPPRLDNVYMQAGAALVLAFAALTLVFRRVLSAAEVMHVAVFTALACTAMRFVVWAGLFYVLIAPRLFAHAGARLSPSRLRAALAPLGTPLARRATVAGLPLLGAAVITLGAPATAGPAHLAGCAPLQASLRYLDQHYPANTHWFSSEIAGSCARFYTPGRRVFIDTRFDMYPEAFVLHWFRAYQYREHWRALFRHWGIRVVLLPRGAPLVDTLRHDKRWQVVHADPGALIFAARGGTAPARSAD